MKEGFVHPVLTEPAELYRMTNRRTE